MRDEGVQMRHFGAYAPNLEALFTQCVQIFSVKMREILLKMREKMRQPKMSTFYCIFARFRGGLVFDCFKIIFEI